MIEKYISIGTFLLLFAYRKNSAPIYAARTELGIPHSNRSQISNNLATLEEKGLITRNINGRSSSYALSFEGNKIVGQLVKEIQEILARSSTLPTLGQAKLLDRLEVLDKYYRFLTDHIREGLEAYYEDRTSQRVDSKLVETVADFIHTASDKFFEKIEFSGLLAKNK